MLFIVVLCKPEWFKIIRINFNTTGYMYSLKKAWMQEVWLLNEVPRFRNELY